MKKYFAALMLLLVMLLPLCASAQEVCILFTHDMHSHFIPHAETDGTRGGFARLKTLIDSEKAAYDDALLLDAGDFSMGTLFQAAYESDAMELTMMAHLGYDAATLGNHEFDYRGQGLANMLAAAMDNAKEENVSLPPLLCANIDWSSAAGEDGKALKDAMDSYGCQESMIFETNGVRVGVFGVMGKDSVDCAPLAPVAFTDVIEAAKKQTALLEQQGAELIICLSHSGVWAEAERSEDELLAKAVPQIDLIISGHTHTTLEAPIVHGSTVIVSCGEYTRNLGKIVLERSGDGWKTAEYALIPTADHVAEDAVTSEKVAQYRDLISKNHLSVFGYTFDQVLCQNPGGLLSERDLLADALFEAVKAAEGDAYDPIALAVVPDGVIRGTLPAGNVTTSDAFNILSLGIGADKLPGYPLVSIYATGRELYDLAEVDASVSQIMNGTHLFPSGGGWAIGNNRLILSRVSDVWLYDENGQKTPVEMDKLYRIVTDMYSCQMLGSVKSKSFGLLSLEPKDKNGNPITDFEQHVIYDQDGAEVKAWVALADYLSAFGGEDGSGAVPASYQQPSVRIERGDAGSIGEFFRHAGRIWYVILGAVAALIVIILLLVLFVRAVIRAIRRRKARK